MLSKDRGISTFVLILMVAVVMSVLIVAVILFRRTTSSPQASSPGARPAPTAEQKAYLPLLEFTEARMSAAENFLGDTVVYLDVRVTNKGAKVVRHLDVELQFVDTLNQVVLRETAHPLTDRTPPLKPGESRSFRVSFEHIPVDWNQSPPTITPVFIQF